MIRKCVAFVLLSLTTAAAGCHQCDCCYPEGPIVDGEVSNCGGCTTTPRSGSVFGAPTNGPVYMTPGPQQAQPPMVPVR